MKRQALTGIFVTIVSTCLFICSCSNSSDNGGPAVKETLTDQEQADLVKMATVFSAASMPFELPTSDLGMLAKKAVSGLEDGCDSIGPGAEACYHVFEDGWEKDTIRMFSDAAHNTPFDPENIASLSENIYMTFHTLSHTSEMDSDILMSVQVNVASLLPVMMSSTEADETEIIKNLNASLTIKGYADYSSEDMRIDFTEISIALKEGTLNGNYNFKIMDGKYDIKANFSFNIEKIMNETATPEDMMLEGAIVNTENEQIGTFVVDFENGVTILDNMGNVVEPAAS